jgi:phage repressor protein C with HTH and peptisase S24 domain
MFFETTHLVSVMATKKVPIKGDQEFLERLRIASEGNYSAFARKRGLKSSALRHYVERGGEPTRPGLLKIANASGINLRWLAEGVGPMRGEPITGANPADQAILNKERSRWFNELLELDPTADTRIRKFLVQSNSMSPTLEPGQFAIVNEADQKLRKGIFLLREESQATIKRLRVLNDGSVMIQEDNPLGNSEYLAFEEFGRRYQIVGRVLATLAAHLDP